MISRRFTIVSKFSTHIKELGRSCSEGERGRRMGGRDWLRELVVDVYAMYSALR